MFVELFFHFRRRGLAVSLHEWMDLLEALRQGLGGQSLAGFYHLCRAVCVKSEELYDLYDRCFAEYFDGVEAPAELHDELRTWLEDALPRKVLSPEELARLQSLDLEALRKTFEERLKEQTERHDGGNRWIGTGGTSPFGHSGAHPSGIRVGGVGLSRSAVQVAMKRRFEALRGDAVLDTRQLGVALRKLRVLSREGREEELDLDGTIAATARNAGEIDVKLRPARRNALKLLLLVDVGGSMTPYAHLTERLFSAARAARHFKELRVLYFHNCWYDDLFVDPYRLETIPTRQLLREIDPTWRLIVVGDAAMNPLELTMPGGAIDYDTRNEEPGLVWLARVREALPRSVWLNPEPKDYWGLPSIQLVRRVFPEMQPLTVDGLAEAVRLLARAARRQSAT